MRKKKHLIGYLLSVFCLPPFLLAQTNTENFSQLQFNFNNPGARAAAMGGAFISIADDATAAEANPAGLTALLTPEVSFELKRINYTRNIFNFDSEGSTLIDRDFKDWVMSPAFASVVYPFSAKNVTVSVFRHELVNFKSTYFTHEAIVPGLNISYFPVNNETEIKVANWGAAAGYRINDKFSIGLAAGISQLDFYSRIIRDNQSFNTSDINENTSGFFVNAGFIYKINEKISIGGVYKRRPKFSVENTGPNFITGLRESVDINFNVPSGTGIGLSYRVTDVFTVSLDLAHIQYSDLTDDFVVTIRNDLLSSSEFETKDGIEIHFGGEYIGWIKDIGYVLRAGFYTEPSSSIDFIGNTNNNAATDRKIVNTLFTEGDSKINLSFGFGFLLNQHIQFDFATSFSADRDEFTGSLVYRL